MNVPLVITALHEAPLTISTSERFPLQFFLRKLLQFLFPADRFPFREEFPENLLPIRRFDKSNLQPKIRDRIIRRKKNCVRTTVRTWKIIITFFLRSFVR